MSSVFMALPRLDAVDSSRRRRRAVGLKEDAQCERRSHMSVAFIDLLKVHLAQPRNPRQLFQLKQERIETREVTRQAHFDRLFAIAGTALALGRLNRLSLKLICFG